MDIGKPKKQIEFLPAEEPAVAPIVVPEPAKQDA